MKSASRLADLPASISVLADDIVEFHAARVLLLVRICGVTNRALGLAGIDGLTKLAKLDFFVRYPEFFAKVNGAPVPADDVTPGEGGMIRYRYGPWDRRYYHVLAFLESRGLLRIKRSGRSYRITLSESGNTASETLSGGPENAELVKQMREVKRVLGSKSGTALKKLIYEMFVDEVVSLPLGQSIS